MGGRFEGGGRQRAIEIGLMEPDQAKAGRGGVGTQPPQRQLVGCGENDQDVRSGMPAGGHVGMSDGKVERGMCRLTNLRPGR